MCDSFRVRGNAFTYRNSNDCIPYNRGKRTIIYQLIKRSNYPVNHGYINVTLDTQLPEMKYLDPPQNGDKNTKKQCNSLLLLDLQINKLKVETVRTELSGLPT